MAEMAYVPGGTYLMGSDLFYPEERPVHEVAVGSLFIDRFPVTNRGFNEFVAATGHVTQASPRILMLAARLSCG